MQQRKRLVACISFDSMDLAAPVWTLFQLNIPPSLVYPGLHSQGLSLLGLRAPYSDGWSLLFYRVAFPGLWKEGS